MKGRSVVLIETDKNYTTNAHGLYARQEDCDVTKSIFFRCIYNWYREMRLIGGSGGHFSPSYFDKYLKIPIFLYDKQKEITRLYHNPKYEPIATPTKDNLLEWHKNHNTQLGIFELDKELKTIKNELNQIQDRAIKEEKFYYSWLLYFMCAGVRARKKKREKIKV